MTNNIHEECGIFGVYRNRSASQDAVTLTYLGLFACQHRGQESCGIAVNNNGHVDYYTGTGLVSEVFTKDAIKSLNASGKGDMAIGHVRYSPANEASPVNSQPLVMQYAKGSLSISCNGRLTNRRQLRAELENKGTVFQTDTDAEIIAYLVAEKRLSTDSVEKAAGLVMQQLKGAYSFIIMSPHKLIAARDPMGFRPMCIGKSDMTYYVCSESCQIDTAGGTFIRDVAPGEIAVIDNHGITSDTSHCGGPTSFCSFEYIYFARPDSVINGLSVHDARIEAGRILARKHPADADIVIGIPDSGMDAALGYSYESGIPYELGFIKNKYIGRTFIEENKNKRRQSVSIKLNVLSQTVRGKRVVVVDDSIVRGTTITDLIDQIRQAGAEQIHIRISSPPFINVCWYGTDITSKDDLIACTYTPDEICSRIGADSLGFLSADDLRMLTAGASCSCCDGCFTGNYPTDVPSDDDFRDRYAEKIEKDSKTGD
jgi:amidophosphoribosyltransferase